MDDAAGEVLISRCDGGIGEQARVEDDAVFLHDSLDHLTTCDVRIHGVVEHGRQEHRGFGDGGGRIGSVDDVVGQQCL